MAVGGRPGLGSYLKGLWERREFAVSLPLATLRSRTEESALGSFWHLLNPLLLALAYFLVFGLVLDTSRGTDNFITFLIVGVFVFTYTSKSVSSGAKSLTANVGLLRAIRFPRALLPLSSTLVEAGTLLPAIPIALVVALSTGEPVTPAWLLMLPALGLQSLFNLGLALAVARLAAQVRDVQQVLPFVLRLWLYFSGVFYAFDQFVRNEPVRRVLEINPTHVYMRLVRDVLITGQSSPVEVWLLACAWAAVALIGGFIFFWRAEERYGSV